MKANEEWRFLHYVTQLAPAACIGLTGTIKNSCQIGLQVGHGQFEHG